MNYAEYFEKVKNKRWKTVLCNSGEDCWCRIITTEEPIEGDDDNEFSIASYGSIQKEIAEQIVQLHNDSLNDSRLVYNSFKELLEYIQRQELSKTLIEENCCFIEDFDDRTLCREVESRGYYFFYDEDEYVEEVKRSNKFFVFEYEDDILEWIEDNHPEISELTTDAHSNMYKSDCIEQINKLAIDHGWEWLHTKLTEL